MGHNLHLAVINAKDPQEACHKVENYILGMETEDVLFTVGGCLSENNETYIHDGNSSYSPSDNDSNSIEKLNQMFNQIISKEYKSLTRMKQPDSSLNDIDCWQVKTILENITEACDFIKTYGHYAKFDILQHEYHSHKYEEFGVTHVYNIDRDTGKKFIVFIDVHNF